MSPRQDWYLGEFVETLRYELDLQAVPSTVHTDGFPEPGPQMVYVLVAPMDYVALEGEAALPDDDILMRTMLLCLEPPGLIDVDANLELLRRGGAVFCADHRSVAALRRARVPARHLRPGYSKLRDTFDPGGERPIDVMFLGARSLRRTGQLSLCGRILARHDTRLQISDGSRNDSCWGRRRCSSTCTGARTRGFSGSGCSTPSMPGPSWSPSIRAESPPLVPGEDLLTASFDSLPYMLDAALRDGELLGQLRTWAYERDSHVLALRVVRVGVQSGRRRDRGPACLAHGVTRATRDGCSLGPLDGTGARKRPGSRRALSQFEGDEHRGDSVEARGCAPRADRAMGADAPLGIEVVCETPSWSSPRAPRVTVMTALSEGAGKIGPTTIRSPEAGFAILSWSSSMTRQGTTRPRSHAWMQTEPRLRAVLVRHPVTRGLGAARNTALDLAQAPYCLILDAGDEVYPRALQVLVGTLQAMPDAAFAYPIVEVSGMVEAFVAAGGDYLLNVFGWEPGRLRRWTRGAGLSLFNADRLRELAGFATEPQLVGWENHDLQCRVADRGWHAQLVPQILGRYRASPARVTRLSDAPPVPALIDRAPRLLANVHPVL